ncbi:MAG: MATE family efflux transporter [Elusimicrobiota bacterium]
MIQSLREEVRSVLVLAAPLALMQLGLVLYGTVDTLFVGRLGAQAIAAVGLASSTYFLLAIFGIGMTVGADALISRAFGAGRPEVCAALLIHSAALALCVAAPIFLLLDLAGPIFQLVGVQAEVAHAALSYIRVLRFGIFPTLLFTSCRQYLQAMDITRPQLLAVLTGNLVNAGLCWALIFGRLGAPALGIQGGAYATLAASLWMFVVAALASLERMRAISFRFRGFRARLFADLLSLGIPAGAQMLVEVSAFSLMTMFCGRLGAVPLASHQVTINLVSLTFMVPLGISFAAAVRVGQGMGRGDPGAAVRSGYAALGIAVAFMSMTSLLFLSAGRTIVGCFTQDPEVLALGTRLLLVGALFQICDGMQVTLTGSLRGLREARIPMVANFFGHWLIGFPLGLFLAFKAGLGALGLWIGLCTGLVLVAFSLLFVWRKKTLGLFSDEQKEPGPRGRQQDGNGREPDQALLL